MFDIIEYAKKNKCMVSVSPMHDGRIFLSVGEGDEIYAEAVEEVNAAACDMLLAKHGRKRAFELGAKHVGKQLRDREEFFKGEGSWLKM